MTKTHRDLVLVTEAVGTAEQVDFASRAAESRRLLLSCVAASAICLTTASLAAIDFTGFCRLVHPLFWLALTAGSLGVAGSTLTSLWRTWAE